MLALGVKRVIIGTKAVEEPEFLKDMVEKFGADAIAAGVDAKDGMVAIQGWEQVSTVTATDLCLKMKEYGVKHIIYTDISRDGMLSGPNIPATKKAYPVWKTCRLFMMQGSQERSWEKLFMKNVWTWKRQSAVLKNERTRSKWTWIIKN